MKFTRKLKDDLAAVKLLENAKEVFTKYYKENDIKMGPVQGSVKGVFAQAEPANNAGDERIRIVKEEAMKEEPAFERSADDAPDATFVNKGHNKLAGKDIVSLFDYIIEDLNDELANEKKIEEQAQTDYEAEMAVAKKLEDDLKEKKATLEDLIAKRKEDKEAENKDMKENNKDRDAELAYQADITPDCDWILKAFDQRAVARDAEMNGLSSAKDFLAGQVALSQKSQKFNDAKLRNINFLGLK